MKNFCVDDLKNSGKDNYQIGTGEIISKTTQNSKPKYFNEI